jgi:hypothetical protein
MHVQSTNVIKPANASKLATHYQTTPQNTMTSASVFRAMPQSSHLKEIGINP